MLEEWTLWELFGSERNADAGSGDCDLAHGVLPIPLTGPAHDEQVAAVEREGSARSFATTASRAPVPTQLELAWAAQRDQRHEAPVASVANAIAVPRHRVVAVPVVVQPDVFQRGAEQVGDLAGDARERTGRAQALDVSGGDESGDVDDAVVHRTADLAPVRGRRDFVEGRVGTVQPSRPMEDERVLIERLDALGLYLGELDGPLPPQAWLAEPDCPAARPAGCPRGRRRGCHRSCGCRLHEAIIEHTFGAGQRYRLSMSESQVVDYSVLRGSLRALLRRCPACGAKGISSHVASVETICPNCGLDLDRQEGSLVGGVALNTIVAFGCLLAVIVVGFIATRGDASVTGILLPALAVALVVPLLFYASSRLLWVAFELHFWPLEPGEARIAASADESGAGTPAGGETAERN